MTRAVSAGENPLFSGGMWEKREQGAVEGRLLIMDRIISERWIVVVDFEQIF